ncbi:sensor histidine kinase [Alginatibacterium sediminis]|uniref:histidine kinase n=1 Tax=Alginatibacterium sediminis TaxID=2164068 RepID=A0A420E7R0_9ALTE|nr:sensor histidine kinase [Alginatibacterium sediminis]RKF14459.1 sensor histidine kinase [Alginatibacterium sediminis]
MLVSDLSLLLSLAQQMSVFLVIAYLLSKTPAFLPLTNLSPRLPNTLTIYCLFSGFCILGTYFGLAIDDAIANTRAVGAVLGGIFGGPVLGVLVGFTGGMHRYSMGGFTDLACAISTTLEGLVGGLFHLWIRRRSHHNEHLFSPSIAFIATFLAEVMQMGLILSIAKPFEQALDLVGKIALPMIVANAIGAALFMMMIRDRRRLYDKFSSHSSAKALNLAQRMVGVFHFGFRQQDAVRIANIIHEETGVSAVAITDTKQILAFTGLASDHHQAGLPISSQQTYQAIRENRVVFADGVEEPYQCSGSDKCPLGSSLVVPIRGRENEVIGTVKLYESKRRLFLHINRALGEGIAKVIAEQLRDSQLQQQQQLLTEAELKLARAQINPHFLFNALNTISAVVKKDASSARELIADLALFLRINLKRNHQASLLSSELEHVNAYLHIEQVRFADRLVIKQHIAEHFLSLELPTFTLQPLVENAIKHGTAHLLETGEITIYSRHHNGLNQIVVEDNAGLYQKPKQASTEGLGLHIVDTRLRNAFGVNYALQIECEPGQYTRVIVSIPQETKQ